MSYLHTVHPGYIPSGYFSDDNVGLISKKVSELIKKRSSADVVVDVGSIVRVMQRVLEQRLESLNRMNERVIMYIVNDYLTYQIECNKHLNWAKNYTNSQKFYDPKTKRGRVSSWYGKINPKNVPTTSRFYFT